MKKNTRLRPRCRLADTPRIGKIKLSGIKVYDSLGLAAVDVP